MAGSQTELRYPVHLSLDTKELYAGLEALKRYLNNLTPNTKGFKDLARTLTQMEQTLNKYTVKTNTDFIDEK
jgi:hypothetical protein